jgi:predicted ATPase
VARALGVHEAGDRPLVELLVTVVAERHLLLVLDNCEHLLPAMPLVGELLTSGPQLTVLATSRARLRLRGEREFPVPPLALPANGDGPLPLAGLAGVAAVRLFVERAQAVQRHFSLTSEEAPMVAEICRRLEGFPLAIELAAAHVKILPPAALLARLDRRLPMLTGGARDAPQRHGTMRDAIAWSYDLLSADEQALFRQLAVFAGGFTLAAAEWVSGVPSPPAVLDVITSLVEKSLLRRSDGIGGEPRFEMLETIREFGVEQLVAQGERASAQQRHADYFLRFAHEADRRLRGREQLVQLARLEAERDNLRAALAWGLASPDRAEIALRLVVALQWFWFLRDHFSEGRRWLEQALAQPATEDSLPARVRALAAVGLLANHQDDYPAARARLQESVDLARRIGDAHGLAYALVVLGWGDVFHTHSSDLHPLVEESVALFRETGDRWGLATALCTLGMIAIGTGQLDAADAPFAESLAVCRELGDTWGLARALHYSGELARSRRRDELARSLYEECISLYRELDHRGAASIVQHNLGYVSAHLGDARRGLACFAAALAEQVSTRDRSNNGLCHCLAGIAGMAALLGHPEQAARLFGAVDTQFEHIGAAVWPTDRVDYDRNLATARAQLGDEAFAAAYTAGRAMLLNQAIAEALDLAGNAA